MPSLSDAVDMSDGDGGYTRLFFDCIPLCWSFLEKESPQVFDIPRGANVNLDLLSSNLNDEGRRSDPVHKAIDVTIQGAFH